MNNNPESSAPLLTPQTAATKPSESRGDEGQATAEYALLTGAIALVITAVTAWAASTGKIARLLDLVFDHLARGIG